MRIVQLVESMHVGGLEYMALDLARRQKSHGHDVRFYCLYEGGKLADEAQTSAIPVTVFGKASGFSPKLLFQVIRALQHDRPEVIHSHNPAVHPYAALAAKIAGIQAVVNTRHGPLTSEGREYRHWHYKLVQPFTDRFVFVSGHCREILANKLRMPEEKCRVVVNGVETKRFQPLRLSKKEQFKFGTVGRMVPMKGHEFLVRAFASVSQEMPEATLRIVGGGPGKANLEELVGRLGMRERITVEGSTSDIPSVLFDLDVFVISSISEGLPLAVLEAMAAGVPIISTRVGGIPEVLPVGRGVWLCEPQNETALAKKMLEAYRNRVDEEDRERLSQIARERFDLEQMYENYLSVYQEAIEGS